VILADQIRLAVPLALLIAVAVAGAAVGEDDRSTAVRSIEALIADLNSDNFGVRRRATLELPKAGAKAVGPLSEAARTGPLGVQIRVVRILREMYASSDDEATIDRAEEALEILAESANRSLAARADRVLALHEELREQRALVQIEKLGGIIKGQNGKVIDPNNPKRPLASIGLIVLGSGWKGGDEELKYIKRVLRSYIKRVPRLPVLYVSSSGNSSPISKKGREELQAALPTLVIQDRGRSHLGIGTDRFGNPDGCRVTQVTLGTAAAQAGILVRDVITRFGGQPTRDFEALIEGIKATQPGDKVKVEILRGGRQMTLEVVMGEWK